MTKKSTSYLLTERKIFIQESNRLIKQAETLFHREKIFLRKVLLRGPGIVVDYGCAHGAYLSLLSKEFPDAKLVGVDRNTDLVQSARSFHPKLAFFEGDLLQKQCLRKAVPSGATAHVILRFVLQHLSEFERRKALCNLFLGLKKGSTLTIIETGPQSLSTRPHSPSVHFLMNRINWIVKTRGGDRELAYSLRALLKSAGFNKIRQTSMNFGSKELGWPAIEKMYFEMFSARIEPQGASFESDQLRLAMKWLKIASKDKRAQFNHDLIFTHCQV